MFFISTQDQFNDLVEATLPQFKRREYTDISPELQEYIVPSIFSSKMVSERGGRSLDFKVQVRETGNARNTRPLAEDRTGIRDLLVGASVPWSQQTTNWSYSIDEDEFQTDPETIIDILRVRDNDCQTGMVKLHEQNAFSAPTGLDDDAPMGLYFWMQEDTNTADNDGSFNGRDPSGFSSGAAGISSATYARWRNWTFRYTQVVPDDLVRKIKLSLVFTKFMPPIKHATLGYGSPSREILTTYRVIEPLERFAESRNDNLGTDIAKYMGQVVVGGVPMRLSYYLHENDSTDPLLGVDWSVLRPFFSKGRRMRRTLKDMPVQHTGKTVHYDDFMNWVCYDRRKLWRGSLAA
jgi:hypothetical protein